MGEGWETARRRDDGNDWVEVRLAGPGAVQLAELDTSWFVGNAQGGPRCAGRDERGGEVECCRAPGCSRTRRTASGCARRRR